MNSSDKHPSAIAIGTFDGCHRGHIKVLETLRNEAEKMSLLPIVISFNRHPLEVISPEKAPAMLSLPEHRKARIESFGCTPVILPFDESTASHTSKEWIQQLRNDYGMELLVMGYDNTFGRDGLTKNIHDYQEIGAKLGVKVIEAPIVDGISSSAVRRAIIAGNVEEAANMLGYYYTINGPVIHGNSIGRSIGYPTANITPDPRILIPKPGVYAAIATPPDGERLPAVVNIGNRPTVNNSGQLSIEAHIINSNISLYSLPLSLEFHKRLRDEKKFHSLDELSQAIGQDVEKTAKFFQSKDKF